MSISNSIKTLISVVSYYADNPKISTFYINRKFLGFNQTSIGCQLGVRVRYLVGFDPSIARTYS